MSLGKMPLGNADLSLYKNLELESKVSDASPHQLIQLLFDELHVLLVRAKAAHLRSNPDELREKNGVIEKSINIISYLHQSLTEEGTAGASEPDPADRRRPQPGALSASLPHNLSLLYEYMVRQLLSYRIKNQVEILDEISSLVETISIGWRSISDKAK